MFNSAATLLTRSFQIDFDLEPKNGLIGIYPLKGVQLPINSLLYSNALWITKTITTSGASADIKLGTKTDLNWLVLNKNILTGATPACIVTNACSNFTPPAGEKDWQLYYQVSTSNFLTGKLFGTIAFLISQ